MYFIIFFNKQFFGIARQVSEPNDHPCSENFLQLYKTLTTYSILKPPKTGNCKILDSNTPKITINDLKTIFINDTTERFNKINLLRQKLDMLVKQETDIDIVFDASIHSYFKAETKDCIIYYITLSVDGYNRALVDAALCSHRHDAHNTVRTHMDLQYTT